MSLAIDLAEHGRIPDVLLRAGIRRLLRKRLDKLREGGMERQRERFQSLVEEIAKAPLAIETNAANEQHYEVPTAFYLLCLGEHRKYSSCLYSTGNESLNQAERAMLDLTMERAGLRIGQSILELGCGWGSLSLHMARRFPSNRIVAVSNSATQREHIQAVATREGLANLEIRTANMLEFDPGETFDRVVSVEMFEHMRNYRELFSRIASWLKPGGKAFAHIFCHRELAYFFQDQGDDDWVSRHFFTGGIMPSEDLFHQFQDHLRLVHHWRVSGTHYQRTSEHWLQNLDRNRQQASKVLADTYGPAQAARRLQMWRMFFLACAELFGYDGGDEWFVSHYLWEKRA